MSREEMGILSTDICEDEYTVEGLIPTVNGVSEVGISVNSDSALNGSNVLRVIVAKSRQTQAIMSAAATLKALKTLVPAGSTA